MSKIVNYKCFLCALLFGAGLTLQTAWAQGNGSLVCVRTADAIQADAQLSDLLHQIVPTVFIGENGMEMQGENAYLMVECAPSEVGQLYAVNNLFADVRVIKFRLKSSADVVNLHLSKLQNFPQLQYVYFLYEYDACADWTDACLQAKTLQSVQGTAEVTVLYELSIPQ